MFVRAYDKVNQAYYKSMVYGIINPKNKAVLFNPIIKAFELVDYLDESQKFPTPLYELINANTENWIELHEVQLLKFKKYCAEKNFTENISLFRGYKEVFDNFDFMLKLLKKEKIDKESICIPMLQNEDADEWDYIRTQADADNFMNLFCGFHDSTMNRLSYEEEYDKKELKVIFDNSGWWGIAELCFEGLLSVNLRPYSENQTREIFDASLIVKDETVFWADERLKEEDMSYDGTYIKALNLKWRKIG